MKLSHLIIIVSLFLACINCRPSTHSKAPIASTTVSQVTDLPCTNVIVDGDEMPGIGADKANPDTALVWFNQRDRRIHIKYLSPSK